MRLRAFAIALALAGGALARAPAARADDAPSPERLKAAADEFDRGRRAYLAKSYVEAAEHFESAFRDAPRAETLRLAIRARREANELARAATLAAIAERSYADDAATAKLAKETLAEARPKLVDYTIRCTPECAIAADGRVVSQSDAREQRIFLAPGPHDLGVSFRQGGSLTRHVDAKAGSSQQIALEAPPAATPEPAEPAGERPVAERPVDRPNPPPSSSKPLGPVVFFIAGGLTVAAGAATVVSGIDAKNNPGVDAVRKACAGKDESCPLYQDGRSAQLRTNILLGATIGAAVVTGVIGLFFTDWSGGRSSSTRGAAPPRVGVAAAPLPGGGAALVHGSF